jgi:hypothetical protein
MRRADPPSKEPYRLSISLRNWSEMAFHGCPMLKKKQQELLIHGIIFRPSHICVGTMAPLKHWDAYNDVRINIIGILTDYKPTTAKFFHQNWIYRLLIEVDSLWAICRFHILYYISASCCIEVSFLYVKYTVNNTGRPHQNTYTGVKRHKTVIAAKRIQW